jgi:hypothetical protein
MATVLVIIIDSCHMFDISIFDIDRCGHVFEDEVVIINILSLLRS